nr:ParA family protein [Nostoc linckia FACHB-104]
KPRRDGEEAREMLTEAGLPVFKGSIRDAVAFQKAALAGVPVNKVGDQRAKIAWRDYQSIGIEVMK